GRGSAGHHRSVVRMHRLQRALHERFWIGAARTGFGADPEQVGRGAVEVQALAVDVHALEQALRVPARELLFGQVRDLPAYALAHVVGIVVEVHADATHALALVFEFAGLRRRGGGQRGSDRRFGRG